MTPGRYLAVGCIAIPLFMLVFAVHIFVVEVGRTGLGQAVGAAVVWASLAGGVALLAALFPGIPLIFTAHLLLRPHPEESIHIAAFALIGFVTATVVIMVFPVEDPIRVTLIVGTVAATAAGRWVVGQETITHRSQSRDPEPHT